MQNDDFYIGIDVSKKTLHVALLPKGKVREIPNSSEGIDELVRICNKWNPKLIVMESTGGLEKQAATALFVSEHMVAVVNPRQIRDFARAKGLLEKTDELDAMAIAEFGRCMQPEPRAPKPENIQELSSLMSRRQDLIQMRTSEKTGFIQQIQR